MYESGIVSDAKRGIMPRFVPGITRSAGKPIIRLVALLGFGLMLGACSKCDVPDWFHTSRAPPQTCHGGAPTQ